MMNSNMTLFKGGKKSVTTTAFDKLPEKQHEKKNAQTQTISIG